jgi:rhodanese-related sulfurtransferase
MSKAVNPEEAESLMVAGHTYVDVRSEPEFEAGHPAGAVNVPLSNMGPSGLEPNPDFMPVMERAFAKDAKLVIGCKTGARSRRAVALLTSAGYTDLADMVAGFGGSRDAFGRLNPGWSQKNLPVETGTPAGRGYADMKKR